MISGELGVVLGRLTAARRPWLALVPAVLAAPVASDSPSTRLEASPSTWLERAPDGFRDAAPDTRPESAAGPPPRGEVTVIDATDLRGAALTLDPFEPAPGCRVQAHADRLLALFDAAFRPPGPVRAAIRLALRRVYTDRGWDLATGTALPGSAAAPGIPSFADVQRAAAADDDDPRIRAAVRGFLDAGPGSLWLGPARYFLAGGHPADVPGVLRGNVIFTTGDMADEDGAVFLTGVLLIRLAEHLRAGGGPGPPPAVVAAIPAHRLRRLRGLLDELRVYGTEVISARPPGAPVTPPYRTSAVLAPELAGRRSAACGPLCRRRPCSGYELHAAGLLAASDGAVGLRLWGQALVLAFVTGRPLPRVPSRVRRNWSSLEPRTRECLLATVVHAAVMSRAPALRHSYEPGRLTAAAASTAAGLLAAAVEPGGGVLPVRAGRVWVIPQLRWLHEADRLYPSGASGERRLRPADIAPPLDFELAGLPDWPGIRVGQRRDALRRHRLSMARESNRTIAATALLGAGPEAVSFERDLAETGLGDQPGWLTAVLSWPSWLIGPGAPEDMPEAVPSAGTG